MRRSLATVFALTLLAPLAQAASKGAAKDEETLRKLQADFAELWNKNDHQAMAAMWAEDGDLINPLGRVARGRAEVAQLFMDEQTGPFKGTRFTSNVTHVRMLKPDVAEVDVEYVVSGADGKPMLKGTYTAIDVKKGGRWWVSAARAMVPVTPPPAMAPARPAAAPKK